MVVGRIAVGRPDSGVAGDEVRPHLPAPRQANDERRSQSGFAGPPLIVLNGSASGGGVSGLQFAAGSDGSIVRGLVIQQFATAGIDIKGANRIAVAGNYVGTDVHGTAKVGNGIGVFIDAGSANNAVGGVYYLGNLISGNGSSGVEISGAGTTGNAVLGNEIGTDEAARPPSAPATTVC